MSRPTKPIVGANGKVVASGKENAMTEPPTVAPPRPTRFDSSPVPDLPDVSHDDADHASVEFSHYRSTLSRFRTGLSEHRTDLSEFRTDLSQHRTELSDNRTEMSMRRTGMSFQRTRMSADRTLMSEIRTSLSLIGFGFTIYQVFQKFAEAGVIHRAYAPRNFGATLIVLGIALLVGGIIRQMQFAGELRRTRAAMMHEGLVHAESTFPVSLTLIVAIVLTLVGVAAIAGIVFDMTG
jgi:uncharacterized membrane protein YidH (DUF202 family)